MDVFHPFRRSETEVERDRAEVEAQGQAEGPSEPAVGDATNDATPPVDRSATPTVPSATKSNHEMAREILENLGKPQPNERALSLIGPSDLLDRLEEAKTGKSKIKAGRLYVAANPDETSERMVEVLGSNDWPSGTVAKATAILEAHPVGGA